MSSQMLLCRSNYRSKMHGRAILTGGFAWASARPLSETFRRESILFGAWFVGHTLTVRASRPQDWSVQASESYAKLEPPRPTVRRAVSRGRWALSPAYSISWKRSQGGEIAMASPHTTCGDNAGPVNTHLSQLLSLTRKDLRRRIAPNGQAD